MFEYLTLMMEGEWGRYCRLHNHDPCRRKTACIELGEPLAALMAWSIELHILDTCQGFSIL